MSDRIKIENWFVVFTNKSDFVAPEIRHCSVCGIVDDRPKAPGKQKKITTSTLKKINYRARMVWTQNSIYELGTPNPEWLQFLRDEKLWSILEQLREPPVEQVNG